MKRSVPYLNHKKKNSVALVRERTIPSTKEFHNIVLGRTLMLRTMFLLQCIHGKWTDDGIHRPAHDHH